MVVKKSSKESSIAVTGQGAVDNIESVEAEPSVRTPKTYVPFRSLPVNTLFEFHGIRYIKVSRCKKKTPKVYVGIAQPIPLGIHKPVTTTVLGVTVTKKKGKVVTNNLRPFVSSTVVIPIADGASKVKSGSLSHTLGYASA